jgi:translation initiation factor 2 beta subunit (eIF-2beta)/eIF-5
MENQFYVYVYLNPLKPGKFIYDNLEFEYEPFYIGRGKSDRSEKHIWFAKNKPKEGNRHKSNTINKIINEGTEPIIKFIMKDLDFTSSIDNEIKLIKLIGRNDLHLGPLTNMTDGGEGTLNRVYSEETRNKLSAAAKLRTKEKNGRYKMPVSEITREKIRQTQIGKTYSDEVNKSKGLPKEKNPMYGKSVYDVWLSKFGKEIADEKLEAFKEKCRNRKTKK